MRVVFDTRELYFLTQFVPVARALARRGVECTYLAYRNREGIRDAVERAFVALGAPVVWCRDREEGVAFYRREQPDWVFFGNGYAHLAELPPGTRTAQLYHGIGMKSDTFGPNLMKMDVRFVEGPYYEEILRSMYPEARIVGVGYAKTDPLFGPAAERPRLDLTALGLDPDKRTLLYAPTHSPSSFPNMADDWPADFADYNLLVKAHHLSHVSSSRGSHRRKMELWSRAPNCYVASPDEWDPLPFLGTADLLISDVSSILFEFAGTDRPIVWCDFLDLHFFRRGLFRWRFRKRMHRAMEDYWDIAAHAERYRDLRRVVEEELASPGRYSERRLSSAAELLGPTDGRVAERIASWIEEASAAPVESPRSVAS